MVSDLCAAHGELMHLVVLLVVILVQLISRVVTISSQALHVLGLEVGPF